MEKKKAVIIGGGIAGLASAWFLRDGFEVSLFEKEARLGGWIQSKRVGGFFFERGPRSLRGGKVLDLAKELGLENEIVWADKGAKKRYLYAGGKLKNATRFLWGALPGILTEWTKKKGEGEESVKAFVSRRCGRYVYEVLMDPMISGIYAGDGEKLSFQSCFPTLYEKEQKLGSLTKGLLWGPRSYEKRLFTFKRGLKTLVEALETNVSAGINVSAPVDSIEIHKRCIRVSALGRNCEGDEVILALPAREASRLLRKYDPELSRLLDGIETVSVAVVNVGYQQSVLSRKGFGYLIPGKEKERVLGVVWDSSVFPEQNGSPSETRLTVMVGGARMTNFDELDNQDFIDMASDALEKHLGIKQSPDMITCSIAKNAIPQYTVGYERRLQTIKKRLLTLSSRLHLIGSHFNGVSVGDCILGAERLSESLF